MPGVYSLDVEDESTGLDELIARDDLLEGEADLIINIVDASNLERNLYLTTQIFGKQDSQGSILSATSQAVTPLFAPMGISQENWPATVGIFTGVFAKEAMVGSLDSLYGQLAAEESGEVGEAEEFDFFGAELRKLLPVFLLISLLLAIKYWIRLV